jgi:hypothetical protein
VLAELTADVPPIVIAQPLLGPWRPANACWRVTCLQRRSSTSCMSNRPLARLAR